jgi:hypothetical protein
MEAIFTITFTNSTWMSFYFERVMSVQNMLMSWDKILTIVTLGTLILSNVKEIVTGRESLQNA